MSKQWYYEMMGTAIGPISSAELKHRVQQGKIPPDTPIRLGPDGKWQSADRVKGLLDAPTPPAAPATKPAAAGAVPTAVPKAATPAVPLAAASVVAPVAHAESTYHLTGDTSAHDEPEEIEPAEYDFFRFVGFEQALGSRLHQLLCVYCHTHHLTITQATRRAVATLLDHKELAEDKPSAPAPTA
jgi:hypothetical protein